MDGRRMCHFGSRFGTQNFNFRIKTSPKKSISQDFTLAISARKTGENHYLFIHECFLRHLKNFSPKYVRNSQISAKFVSMSTMILVSNFSMTTTCPKIYSRLKITKILGASESILLKQEEQSQKREFKAMITWCDLSPRFY